MTTNETLKEKSLGAARQILEREGYELVEPGWAASDAGRPVDLVCEDGGCIVFVYVNAFEWSEAEEFPSQPDVPQDEFEAMAVGFFLHHEDLANCRFRADVVSVARISDHRAIVRHTTNAQFAFA